MKRLCLALLFMLFACDNEQENSVTAETTELLDAIVSSAVAFSHSDLGAQSFFETPTLAYVSGHFYFEDDLAPDIIFGLDIELLEGLEDPVRFEGADWMALAGFDRTGRLWFPVGYPENREGIPTNTDNWMVQDFEVDLQPNTWYKMTIQCDFDMLEFVSIRLEGGGVDKTLSITGNPLEYPNYAPFDKASLTAYTFALRGVEFAPENEAGFEVYFDDIEMGIQSGTGQFTVIFEDGFENQVTVGDIPITNIPIALDSITEALWYLENEDAKLLVTDAMARTGQHSLKCIADLRK
ncbi:MAG: hypothetical protein AAGB24_14355 [Bacteroidota bacterium]